MEKAIRLVDYPMKNLKENDVAYDLDFRPFKKMVDEMKELGAPIEIEDIIYLVEGKLSGSIKPNPKEPFLIYTFVFKKETAES